MQLEAADWSIQATPPVHLQGFTPTCVQYWKAANIWARPQGTQSPPGGFRCPPPSVSQWLEQHRLQLEFLMLHTLNKLALASVGRLISRFYTHFGVNVHGNVHASGTDWPGERLNEVSTACL